MSRKRVSEQLRDIPGLTVEQAVAIRMLMTDLITRIVEERLKRQKRRFEREMAEERAEHLRKLEAIQMEFCSELSQIAKFKTLELREKEMLREARSARLFLKNNPLPSGEATSDKQPDSDPYTEWRNIVLTPLTTTPPDDKGNSGTPPVASTPQ